MKAAPEIQLRLLDLQDLDATLHRLAVRRASLPAFAAVAAAEAEMTRLDRAAVEAETQVADADRASRKLEADIEQVRARSTRDQERLDSGAVAPKDMTGLQSELVSLARRQATLEDEELEILQTREDAQNVADHARGEQALARERRDEAGDERDRELAAIDVEVSEVTGRRAGEATDLPADLVALYDRLRADRGGVGAAALRRRRCEGCNLELAGNELADVRAAQADDVLRHDDCGRILVRTAESGL